MSNIHNIYPCIREKYEEKIKQDVEQKKTTNKHQESIDQLFNTHNDQERRLNELNENINLMNTKLENYISLEQLNDVMGDIRNTFELFMNSNTPRPSDPELEKIKEQVVNLEVELEKIKQKQNEPEVIEIKAENEIKRSIPKLNISSRSKIKI